MQQKRLINNSSQLNTFWAIILPIFSSSGLFVTACGITHPRCCRPRPATARVHYTTSCNTQSSVPEDGQNNCPKNVELTGIINKPLILHLVGCLYYLYQRCNNLIICCVQTMLAMLLRQLFVRSIIACFSLLYLSNEDVRCQRILLTHFSTCSPSKCQKLCIRQQYFLNETESTLQSKQLNFMPLVQCFLYLSQRSKSAKTA